MASDRSAKHWGLFTVWKVTDRYMKWYHISFLIFRWGFKELLNKLYTLISWNWQMSRSNVVLIASDFTACKTDMKDLNSRRGPSLLNFYVLFNQREHFFHFLGVECTVSFAITLHTCSSRLIMAGGFSSLYHLLIINFLWITECFHLKDSWDQHLLYRMIQLKKT